MARVTQARVTQARCAPENAGRRKTLRAGDQEALARPAIFRRNLAFT
jgi:hypothetical protein